MFGTSSGLVMVEVWDARGARTCACAVGVDQRLAVAPCAGFAVAAARRGIEPGLAHPVEWASRDEWLRILASAGVTVIRQR
jgi:hypothetical protein